MRPVFEALQKLRERMSGTVFPATDAPGCGIRDGENASPRPTHVPRGQSALPGYVACEGCTPIPLRRGSNH
jgi:hypothetical protein